MNSDANHPPINVLQHLVQNGKPVHSVKFSVGTVFAQHLKDPVFQNLADVLSSAQSAAT